PAARSWAPTRKKSTRSWRSLSITYGHVTLSVSGPQMIATTVNSVQLKLRYREREKQKKDLSCSPSAATIFGEKNNVKTSSRTGYPRLWHSRLPAVSVVRRGRLGHGRQ